MTLALRDLSSYFHQSWPSAYQPAERAKTEADMAPDHEPESGKACYCEARTVGHPRTRLFFFQLLSAIVGFEAKPRCCVDGADLPRERDCVVYEGSDAARAFRPACESHSALLFNHASFDSSPKPATFHPPKTHPYPRTLGP